MKLKEITETAAALLGWEEPFADNKDAGLLTRCANLTVSEIAAEYAPVKHTETVNAKNGLVYFGALEKDFLELVSVESADGGKLEAKIYPDYFKTSEGRVTVTYAYLPPKLSAEDDVPVGDRRITLRVFAYGAAAEYCMISGRFDEAVMLTNKYTAALKNALFTPAGRVKERCWF